jgi:plasmid replication initiation protein
MVLWLLTMKSRYLDHALNDSGTSRAIEPQRGKRILRTDPVNRQPSKDDGILFFRDDAVELRSDLTQREYKFVFYLLAMIDPKVPEMQRTFRMDVGRFASLSGLDPRPLWTELKELTLSLTKKQLSVYGAIFPSGQYRPGGYRGIVNWLSSVGYYDKKRFLIVSFTPEVIELWNKSLFKKLGPNQRFEIPCDHFFKLRSVYSGRLYTYLSGRRHEKMIKVDVARLREILLQPQVQYPGEAPHPLPLEEYRDFKRRALDSAVDEINRLSDLEVQYIESRAKGSKTVIQLIFNVQEKPASQISQNHTLQTGSTSPTGAGPLPALPAQQSLQFGNPLTENSPDSRQMLETVERIRAQWGLTSAQTRDLESAIADLGAAYVLAWETHALNNGKNPVGLFCDAMKTRRPLKVAKAPPAEKMQRPDVDWDWQNFLVQSGMAPNLIPQSLSDMSDRMFKDYILPEHRKRVRERARRALEAAA